MTPSASLSSPLSAFGHFLYATVGDDKNGMALTLLSALARQNVDPWQEAADLSRLPHEAAMQRITLRLETIPGDRSLVERTAIAVRLLALLPGPPAKRESPGEGFLHQFHAVVKRTGSSELSLVLIYVILMSAGGWMFASAMRPTASAPTAHQVLLR